VPLLIAQTRAGTQAASNAGRDRETRP
jgi:hypothetical protein